MLAPGTQLGHFEIIALLGVGGMGEVYRARDTQLHREVALKVMKPGARDLKREAQTLAGLNHPHIAAVYGFEDGALVMELVEGRNLAGPLPPDEALPLAVQIAEALEYAHEHGVVHRDLKPANVKVTVEGSVKVLDFGLAKALTSELTPDQLANSPTLTHLATMPGVILGTAAYMAPEQAKGKPVDRRADIWAFGCVLYEMLTGVQAFSGETVTDVLAAVVTRDPDWTRLPPTAPPHVRALLARCLRKDPRQRLQAIGDARIMLQEPADAPVIPSSAARRPGGVRWPWVAATIVFAITAGLAWRNRPAPTEAHSLRFTVSIPEGAQFGFGLALSPDGSRLVYAATVNGKQSLWLRSMDALTAQPLDGTEDGEFPFWSPNSAAIAFFADGELKRLDLATDSVRSLCAVTASDARGGSWSAAGGGDGTIVFSPDLEGALQQVPASGGSPVPATLLDHARGDAGHRWPFFLPDSRHFLFTAESTGLGRSTVALGSLGSTGATPLFTVPNHDTQVIYAAGFLLYSLNGSLVATRFDPARERVLGSPEVLAGNVVPEGIDGPTGYVPVAASPNGELVYRTGSGARTQMAIVDATGKLVRTIGPPGVYETPELSPDGKRIIVGIPDAVPGVNTLWMVDAATGTRSRFSFERADDLEAAWSPDSRWVYYGSDISGSYAIYRKLADGAQPPQFVYGQHDGLDVPENFSRDGRILLFNDTGTATNNDEWWMALGPPPGFALGPVTPYLRTPARELYLSLSPDSHLAAYQSNTNGAGDWEVFVSDFPHHVSQWQIASAATTGGSYWPIWSPDGHELYFISGGNMMAVTVSGSNPPQFSSPRVLFPFNTSDSLTETNPDYEPLPGGRGFFVNLLAGADAQSPITAVTHWQQMLPHP